MITKSQLMPNLPPVALFDAYSKRAFRVSDRRAGSAPESRGRISITIHKRDRPSFCTEHRPVCFCTEFFFSSCFSLRSTVHFFPTRFVAVAADPTASPRVAVVGCRPAVHGTSRGGKGRGGESVSPPWPHNSSQTMPPYTAQNYKLAGSCRP
jgi:hypothetical protein